MGAFWCVNLVINKKFNLSLGYWSQMGMTLVKGHSAPSYRFTESANHVYKRLVVIILNPIRTKGQSNSSSQLHSRLARLIGKRVWVVFQRRSKGFVSIMSNI